MSLFAPILRLCLLFFNIYGTFKTLKPPRVSSRSRTGLPSQTNTMQRKREMKGCLAVWIVWTCLAVYERHFEGILSLFIPFYDEFKAIILLFLIATRARGAEPIFLHVIRPLLRPYTATIDTVLDLIRMIGDIIYALFSFFAHFITDLSQSAHHRLPAPLQAFSPFTYFSSSLPAPHDPFTTYNSMSEMVTQNGEHPGYYEVTYPPHRAPPNNLPGIPSSNFSYPPSHNNIEGLPPQSENPIFIPPLPEEIPLQTNFPDSSSRLNPRSITPPSNPSHHSRPSNTPPAPPREDAWEWDWDARQYPSFPSAYPPTPLTNNSSLPSTRTGKGKMRLAKDPWRQPDGTVLEELAEDEGEYNHSHSSHSRRRNEEYSRSPHQHQQGFHQSLLPPRKPLNPGYGVRDLSDDNLRGRLQTAQTTNTVRYGHESNIGLGRFAGSSTSSRIHESEELDDSESDAGDAETDRRALAGIGTNESMDIDLGERGLESDSEVDSDGSFNVTMRTPRTPLPPSGSATSIMTLKSTVRTRASARSLFASPSGIYPSPLSVHGDGSRHVQHIEEEDGNNDKSELSSRSSSRSRDTRLTTTNDENDSTHTISSGSASVESLALASSASISVSDSSLEAALKSKDDVLRASVRAGQKRRHEMSFSHEPDATSSFAHGTPGRGKRLARSKRHADVERLTTEDERDEVRASSSLTMTRKGRSTTRDSRQTSKVSVTMAKSATVKPGATESTLTTVPLRKRRKVDPIPPSTTEPKVGAADSSESSDKNATKTVGRGGKTQTQSRAAPTTTARPKRPMVQRSEGSKSSTSTITQSKPPMKATNTRSSSRLRKAGMGEASGTLQP